MKAPKAQEFPTIPDKTATPVAVVRPKPPPAQKQKVKPKTIRRSYNLSVDADEKINLVALKMSQKRGKMVSASEALRTIVDAYQVKS